MNKVYLGADHAGFDLKERIKLWLTAQKIPYDDCGNMRLERNDDYPDFAEKVALKVIKHNGKGILFCGSSIGVCIAANKVPQIRAANPHTLEQVVRSREDEDANILCLSGGGTLHPQQGMSFSKAQKMILTFLNTPFSGAPRHRRRIKKIQLLEQKYR
ncbi:RpiB/LacA/LacB family sugar-phosphate isomerase [Candidatus Woesearchaeota archaeon]|nr:RpiB/LacA/LacB family sugar-phosphate isomerase [Candidatus Woesearchaeota archaeon]